MNARTILTAAFMAVFALAWAAPAQADLVGYWNFNEGEGTTAYDSTANNNDGTLKGTPGEEPSWVDGRTGDGEGGDYAIRFASYDWSKSWVDVPYDSSLHSTETFSFTMWVYEDNAQTYGNFFSIMNKDDGGDSDRVWYLQSDNNTASAYMWSKTNSDWQKTLGWDIPDDTWHHITATFDYNRSPNDVRIYMDGTEYSYDVGDDLDPWGGEEDPDPDGEIGIGGFNQENTNLIGDMDEVSVWDETLSAGKAIAMYNIFSVNSNALGDYTVDKMETLFDVFDTGTADTVTSDVGDLTWEKFTGTAGTEGDVQHLGGDEYVVWFDGASGVKTVPPRVDGDLDGDGDVDLLDFGIFQTNFTGPDGSGMTPGDGDLDGDGDVDLLDFGTFQANFTGPGGGMTVNPEPATLALVGLGGLATLLGRRKARR